MLKLQVLALEASLAKSSHLLSFVLHLEAILYDFSDVASTKFACQSWPGGPDDGYESSSKSI